MNVETASRLVSLRKKKGLSQEELAEKIGVSRQAISKWERAESSPDTENLIALASVYGLSIDSMLNQDNPKAKAHPNNDQYEPSPNEQNHSGSFDWKRFPYPVIVTIVYLILGTVFDLWHPGWLVFLTIPLWASLSGKSEDDKQQREKRKAARRAERRGNHRYEDWMD